MHFTKETTPLNFIRSCKWHFYDFKFFFFSLLKQRPKPRAQLITPGIFVTVRYPLSLTRVRHLPAPNSLFKPIIGLYLSLNSLDPLFCIITMVYRGGLLPNPMLHDAAIGDRPNNLQIRGGSRCLHLLAVAFLMLTATLFDGVGLNAGNDFLNLFIQSLLAVAVVVAFNVAMLGLLLPLAAPFSEAVSPAVASRLERAAAVGSVATLLLATALLVSVSARR